MDIGGHLLDQDMKMIDFEYLRSLLYKDVEPNQEIQIEVKVKAPNEKGTYFVEFDLVDECITWFVAYGNRTVKVKFDELVKSLKKQFYVIPV